MAELRIIGPVPEEQQEGGLQIIGPAPLEPEESGLRIIGPVPDPEDLTARESPAIVPSDDADLQDPARRPRPDRRFTAGALRRLGDRIAASFSRQGPAAPAAAPGLVSPQEDPGAGVEILEPPSRAPVFPENPPMPSARGRSPSPEVATQVPAPASERLQGNQLTADPSLELTVLRAVPRGAVETAATALEPLALSRRLAQGMVRDFTSRARRAGDLTDEEFAGFLRDVTRSDIPKALQAEIINSARGIRERGEDPEAVPDFSARIEGNPPARAAAAMQEFAEQTFPIPKEQEGRLPVQVARGIGSTGVFLLSRFLPGGQILLPSTAGLIGSGEAIERAIAQGAADEQQARAALFGVAPGLTDILPIERLLRPFTRAPGFKGGLYAVARRAVEQGVIEGTQEGIQTFMQNVIAKFNTLPQQDLFEGIKEAGIVGFLVGMLFGSGAGALSRPKPPPTRRDLEATLADPRPISEIQAEQEREKSQEAAEPAAPGTPAAVEDQPAEQPAPPAAAPGVQVEAPVQQVPASEEEAAPAEASPTAQPVAAVPKRVPRTQAQLEKILDEWDAQRNRPDVSPEVKAEARRLQQEAAETLQGLEVRAAASDFGRAMTAARVQAEAFLPGNTRRIKDRRAFYVAAFMDRIQGERNENQTSIDFRRGVADAEDYLGEQSVEKIERPEDFTFTLRTVRGRETVFTLPPDVNAIGKLRRSLEKKTAERKFFSKAPTSPVSGVPAEGRKPPWEMSPDEIDAALEREAEDEKAAADVVFGPVGARKYERLQRRANSASDLRAADEASAQLGEMEEGLTPEQETRLFGTGESGPSAEELADFRRALNDLDDGSARRLGRSLGPAITRVGEKTDPAEMSHQERLAFAQLRRGMEIAQERGFDTAEVSQAALKTAAARFSDPSDVEFMLRRFARPAETQTATTAEAPELSILGPVPAGEELPETAAMEPGERFKGERQDIFDPDQPATGNVLRRETILKDLMTGLGVRLFEGRIRSRKFLGFYRKGIEEVRIKRAGDIETTAHEIGHLLDDRVPEIRRQWMPATKANAAIRDELREISYDRKKLFEGFAEFTRLWMTQKEEAQARAPKFYDRFEAVVGGPEHGPALRRAQEAMHAWFDQAALDRARSKIGTADDINAGLTRPVDKFRQGVFDDLHGIARMERELTGEIAPIGAYETARLTRGKTAFIEGALTIGAPKINPDGSHGFAGKGLSQILDPVTDRLDDFLMYAVGRSARELRGQGRERLFTKAEIDAMVALETPARKKAFAEYQEWNAAILDFAQAKGLINPTARMMWKRTQYMPFHRVGQPGTFSPVPGDWRGIKALTGGTENLRDILGNMIQNAATLMDAALTNEVRAEVAKLAKRHGGARFMVKIPTEESTVRVHRSEIERAILEALGVERKGNLDPQQRRLVDEIIAGLGGFTAFTLRGQTPAGRNVMAVLEEGKPVYYEIGDPILYRALTRLNRPMRGWLMRFLGGIRRLGQASITLSVDFITANIARDTLMGAVMSRHGFVPIKDSLVGLASRVRQDPNYRDFIANGGGFSSYLLDETAFRKNLARFYRKKGINYQTVLNTPAKLLLGLERIADAFEMSTRLGEFRRARMRGADPREAAFSAREVSTDFAMRGDWAPIEFFYDTVMFLKAAMNGADRLYRGLAKDSNRGEIAAKAGLIALVSAALYAINRDIPMYDDLEDWDRDTHWHFFVPTSETIQAWQDERPLPAMEDRYTHLRYPKIWEIGAMASIAERAVQRTIDGDPKGFGKDVLRVLRDTFRIDPIPQAISPIEELRANRLRFFDRPIETRAMQELEPFARAGPFTSRTLRAMGEKMRRLPRALQVSPAQAEALLRGYFNTWALYGLSLSDAMFFDDKPDLRVDQYPVLRRFFAQEPARHSRHVRELYDLIGEATEVRRTLRHLDRTNRPDMAREQEFRPENLLFTPLTRAGGRLRMIRKKMASVVQAPTLKKTREFLVLQARETKNPGLIGKARRKGAWDDIGELKRILMDDLLRERNRFAKEVMTEVRDRRKREADEPDESGLTIIGPAPEPQSLPAVPRPAQETGPPTRRELENLLEDKRPLSEIRAEREAGGQ